MKEASEAEYWIEFLEAGKYIDDRQKESLISDLTEIMKLLTASVKTAKAGLKSAGENGERTAKMLE